MKKGIALALAAVMCTFAFAACAAPSASDDASASPSASASAEESASAEPSASESAEASASESAEASESASASAEASATKLDWTGDPLGMFFDTWTGKFDTIISSQGAEELGISPDNATLSDLSAQGKDWKSHLEGDTASISTPDGKVTVSATGTDSLQRATVDWSISVDQLASGNSPDVVTFVVAAGAMVETISGDTDTSGIGQVNDIMSTLLGAIATVRDDIVKGEPVTIGDGQFGVSLDPKTNTLSLVGTPSAD